jgi:hypothetical protein
MSPEKLELLRELIRAEIAYNNALNSDYGWSDEAKKNADQVFLEVCLRFCGTD